MVEEVDETFDVDAEDLPADQIRAILKAQFGGAALLPNAPPAFTAPAQRRHMDGLPSHLRDLDALTGGFRPGELTAIVGLPSCGKSTFLQNIARKALLRGGRERLAFVSLDSKKEQIAVRLLFAQAGIDPRQPYGSGLPQEVVLARARKAKAQLETGRVVISDPWDATAGEIAAVCAALKARSGLEMVLVDGAERIASTRSGNAALGEVMEHLKRLAVDLGVPVVTAVGVIPRVPAAPATGLSHVAEIFGTNEPDEGERPLKVKDIPVAVPLFADALALLHRPDYQRLAARYGGDANGVGQKGLEILELALERQAGGGPGRVQIAFLPRWGRMGGVLWESTGTLAP